LAEPVRFLGVSAKVALCSLARSSNGSCIYTPSCQVPLVAKPMRQSHVSKMAATEFAQLAPFRAPYFLLADTTWYPEGPNRLPKRKVRLFRPGKNRYTKE